VNLTEIKIEAGEVGSLGLETLRMERRKRWAVNYNDLDHDELVESLRIAEERNAALRAEVERMRAAIEASAKCHQIQVHTLDIAHDKMERAKIAAEAENAALRALAIWRKGHPEGRYRTCQVLCRSQWGRYYVQAAEWVDADEMEATDDCDDPILDADRENVYAPAGWYEWADSNHERSVLLDAAVLAWAPFLAVPDEATCKAMEEVTP